MPTKPFDEIDSIVGESLVTVENFKIEAGKLEEFARAITSEDPVFRDSDIAADRGLDRVPAPLTYERVGSFPRYTPDEGGEFDLGLRPEYILHGEQSYEYERPLYVGDVLTGTTTVTDVFQREGGRAGTMTFVLQETEYRTNDDELVLTAQSTTIETEGAVEEDDDSAESATDTSAADVPDPDEVDASPGGDPTGVGDRIRTATDLSVGDVGPIVVAETLERPDFVKYAGASGDFNPIHYDEPYATGAGNESVFAQGMLTAGIISRVPARWFPLPAIDSFGVRFQSRVFPGETVVATGEVVDLTDVSGGTAVEIELEATTQRGGGEIVLTGSASATLPE